MTVFDLSEGEVAAERARITEREASQQPTELIITLEDKRSGNAEKIAARAAREGIPVRVEEQETSAGRAIREFAKKHPTGIRR